MTTVAIKWKLTRDQSMNSSRCHEYHDVSKSPTIGISVHRFVPADNKDTLKTWYQWPFRGIQWVSLSASNAESASMSGCLMYYKRRSKYMKLWTWYLFALQWCCNERNGVTNHQPHDCLLNRLFRRTSQKHQSSASPPLWGEFTVDRWIPRTKGQ